MCFGANNVDRAFFYNTVQRGQDVSMLRRLGFAWEILGCFDILCAFQQRRIAAQTFVGWTMIVLSVDPCDYRAHHLIVQTVWDPSQRGLDGV